MEGVEVPETRKSVDRAAPQPVRESRLMRLAALLVRPRGALECIAWIGSALAVATLVRTSANCGMSTGEAGHCSFGAGEAGGGSVAVGGSFVAVGPGVESAGGASRTVGSWGRKVESETEGAL